MVEIPTLIVLSHYPDLFAGFKENVDEVEPDLSKLLVRDGDEIRLNDVFVGGKWEVSQGLEPFIYSRNMNLAWQRTEGDVIIAGDDVRFDGPFAEKLQEVAYSDRSIGFAVPELGGQSCFVCAYIKRALINEIGPMDEQFSGGYGWEDVDYYRRFEAMGWRTQPTKDVKVRHDEAASSYHRRMAESNDFLQLAADRNQARFNKKWGVK